ncbi:MAG: type II toxin-antitoxin system RelB/DinJ family antitoxin [Oscillospiraceae bacterium]|nr:type II toxin-antitoxin system RelB/DinJ family antitoxin [Oscillospiraceae bacterium]
MKEQTHNVLNQIGLDFITAINIYFKRIVSENKIPFELSAKRYYSIEEVAGMNWRDCLDEIVDKWE